MDIVVVGAVDHLDAQVQGDSGHRGGQPLAKQGLAMFGHRRGRDGIGEDGRDADRRPIKKNRADGRVGRVACAGRRQDRA